jgi:glycosyltransferase involved in cell wall biosynthesis
MTSIKKFCKSPKVSIVLPTYNGVKYIRQSIDSCLNQTYKNIELIIVDDGSTDDTPEIIKSYKDKRIIYLRHKKNRGLPNALNTGFENTTGDYLTWTSDDNFYDKKAIKKMLSLLKNKTCKFVYCDFYRFKERNRSNIKKESLPDIPVLSKHNHIGPCFLYSKKVKKIIGNYDTNTVFAEDYDYWIRVSKRFSFCHLAEPLYFYREHPESLSVSKLSEMKVSGILVRIKNKVLEIEPAIDSLVTLKAKKYTKRFKLNKILPKIVFSRRIRKELINFSTKKESFEEARIKLVKILR